MNYLHVCDCCFPYVSELNTAQLFMYILSKKFYLHIDFSKLWIFSEFSEYFQNIQWIFSEFLVIFTCSPSIKLIVSGFINFFQSLCFRCKKNISFQVFHRIVEKLNEYVWLQIYKHMYMMQSKRYHNKIITFLSTIMKN